MGPFGQTNLNKKFTFTLTYTDFLNKKKSSKNFSCLNVHTMVVVHRVQSHSIHMATYSKYKYSLQISCRKLSSIKSAVKKIRVVKTEECMSLIFLHFMGLWRS
jgi:hypothetical protein